MIFLFKVRNFLVFTFKMILLLVLMLAANFSYECYERATGTPESEKYQDVGVLNFKPYEYTIKKDPSYKSDTDSAEPKMMYVVHYRGSNRKYGPYKITREFDTEQEALYQYERKVVWPRRVLQDRRSYDKFITISPDKTLQQYSDEYRSSEWIGFLFCGGIIIFVVLVTMLWEFLLNRRLMKHRPPDNEFFK